MEELIELLDKNTIAEDETEYKKAFLGQVLQVKKKLLFNQSHNLTICCTKRCGANCKKHPLEDGDAFIITDMAYVAEIKCFIFAITRVGTGTFMISQRALATRFTLKAFVFI